MTQFRGNELRRQRQASAHRKAALRGRQGDPFCTYLLGNLDIEQTLDNMSKDDVRCLHAGAHAAPSGVEAHTLDELGMRIQKDVTRTWHNPSNAMIALLAVPSPKKI